MRIFKHLGVALFTLFLLGGCNSETQKEDNARTSPVIDKPTFNVAWSHYVGWEPWGYADYSGILKKWADKQNITIKLSLINDYIESINLYTAGKFDACTMTNMDTLTIPAVGGIDNTALIVGDFSNGNDGIILKNGSSIADLKNREVKLVELSVSHYLLARALDKNGMSEKDVKIVNTSDADIAAMYTADDNGAAVTWNPLLTEALRSVGSKLIFDSSAIPGEIIDLMVVKTDAPDSLKLALTGAWYEVMQILSDRDHQQRQQAIEYMAKETGATIDEFEAQLATTSMFYTPRDARNFISSSQPRKTMELVRQFSFAKGLYGNDAASADIVGISFDDGSTLGDKNNIRLRFTNQYLHDNK